MSDDSGEYFLRLAEFEAWANTKVLDTLRSVNSVPQRAQELLAHIIAAQWLWLARMDGRTSPMAVWPSISLEQCANEIASLSSAWREFLRRANLRMLFEYTNSKGEHFESRVEDALTHIFMHGQYHRGQIIQLLRQAGIEPPYVDFIEAARRGQIS